MSRRRSTRSTSKYFPPKDSVSDDDTVENDSDQDWEHDSDDGWTGAKTTRKRKSTDLSSKKKQVKKPKTVKSSTKGTKKRGKAASSEKLAGNILKPDRNNNKDDPMEDDDSEDDDTADWEEVEDAEVFDIDSYNPELPANLKITIVKPKKVKNNGDWQERLIRQEINRIRKNNQFATHKTHLLLLIARLRYLNSLANDPMIISLALSVVPKKLKLAKESADKCISKLFNCIKEEFDLQIDWEGQVDRFLYLSTISSFHSKVITSPIVFALMLVALCRIFKLHTRLVYSLNPVSVKASDLLNKKSKIKKTNSSASTSGASSVVAADNDSESQERDSTNDWKYSYHWIELFDKSKKQWIPFNFINDEVQNEPFLIVSELGIDTTYVIAIDNDDFISDITPRYAADWVSHAFKKRRLEGDWWENTLKLLHPKSSVYQDADKTEFDKILSKAPLPKTQSGFKNHPLFVLQRDILKYQAIYPPDAPTLGFFNENPVFSRDCVHLLKGRQNWLRSARTIKVGEKPYKVVDSRHKNDDKRGKKATEDLFGEWQTEVSVKSKMCLLKTSNMFFIF